MNNWNFTGNLGKDAETRYTPAGKAVVQFSVAVKSGYGENASTTWARCSLWGDRGTAVEQYLIKGQLVGITGEVQLKEFTNKEGNKQSSLEVRVNELTLLGGRQDKAEAPQRPVERKAAPAPAGAFDDFADDLPFILNANTVSDTAGKPTAYWRGRYGKEMLLLRANQIDY
jgi:single-strand DNA-binding protein